MRLQALLLLCCAAAADDADLEIYDEGNRDTPAEAHETPVEDDPVRRSVDSLLRFPLQAHEVKHRITVSDGEKGDKYLELSGLEEVADAAYAFGLLQGASRQGTRQLQAALCRGQGLVPGAPVPPCTRQNALLLHRDVLDPRDDNQTQKLPGRLEVWEGQAALDAVGGLVRAADLHTAIDVEWFAPALVDALCQDLAHPSLFACGDHPALQHHRKVARVVPINLGGAKGVIGDLILHEHEEAADAILNFSTYHAEDVNAFGRRQLLQNLCGKDHGQWRYRCSRQHALVFTSAPIRALNGTVALHGTTPAILNIWDGNEPADAVKAFCDEVGFSDDDARKLIREVCGEYPVLLLPRRSPLNSCNRLSWVLEVMPVRGPFGPGQRMAHVGDLPIVEGEESHDLAWAFAAERGCEGCPFYKQLAATLCAKPRVTCNRRKARVWRALVDVATQEALVWPPPFEDAFIEVLEGDQVVDGVRQLWFSRNVSNSTLLHDEGARMKRRALAALSCNPDYGLADAKLCARAEEYVARADVERPGATKAIQFNATLPRKHDDRECGDALSRRADYEALVMDRVRACASPAPKKGERIDWKRKKRQKSKAEREMDEVEKAFLDEMDEVGAKPSGKVALDEVLGKKNETAPEEKNATAPADPEACAAATRVVEDVSLSKIERFIEEACVPTVYDFGIKGWAGNSGLQVLGVHNDSEANRRELFQGMKLRRVDGALVESLQDYREALQRKAAVAFTKNVRVNMSLEFLVVDENDRFLTGGQKGEGAGPISVYEGQQASDAVYHQAHLNELIQPNYTALGVQKRFLQEVCLEASRFPVNGPVASGCEAPVTYRPRLLLFEMPLEWLGLTYTFRYYPEDWPPCAGDYNPFHFEVKNTTAWPFGADAKALEALRLVTGGEDPLPATDQDCEPALERFAKSVCAALGPPPPQNCDADMVSLAKQYSEHAQQYRWDEKATPDGIDYYAALGSVRDADNDTLVSSYARVANELQEPLELFETLLANAQKLRERAAALRAAARALLAHANATASAARLAVAVARRDVRRDRAVTFVGQANASLLTDDARRVLVHAFFESNSIEEPAAKVLAETALSDSDKRVEIVLKELVTAGAITEEAGQIRRVDAAISKHRHKKAIKPPKILRLTSLGSAALGAELASLERRHASISERPWPRVARRVASARAGAVVVARGLVHVLEGCKQRVLLADDLLRQARDAAVEANFTIRTLDKPLGEVSKRAWGLHNAFDTLTDKTNREFYDKPCRPVFGACCVRDAPDGGMRITCGS